MPKTAAEKLGVRPGVRAWAPGRPAALGGVVPAPDGDAPDGPPEVIVAFVHAAADVGPALARVLPHYADGRRVGVLAVDPSSPFTGGAVLGDRVRMQEHALDDRVHIRSMATRGALGGLAVAVPAALRVLDAAGCDTTLLETVGVGQSEVAVAATADVTLVLLAPGAGDGVQLAKAGVLEVADVLVVTRADSDAAAALAREVRAMVRLGQPAPGGWVPPVVLLSSTEGTGLDELLAAVAAFVEHQRHSGGWAERRTRRARGEVEQLVLAQVRAAVPGGSAGLDRVAAEVAAGRLDPYAAARRLLDAQL